MFCSSTILYLNKKHVLWICINILCTPILHFTVFSHIAELIVLGIKIISLCWNEHLASQKMRKKYSAIELVTNACFVFLANSAKPKVFQGVILPLNGRTSSSEGNYVLHITVKNCVYFILFLQPKYCDKTVFSLVIICQDSLENVVHFPFWGLCYFKYVFSLSLSFFFFASCANFYKTTSIWIFYDCSSVIWVIRSTKGIRDTHFGYWLRERAACNLHKGNTIL